MSHEMCSRSCAKGNVAFSKVECTKEKLHYASSSLVLFCFFSSGQGEIRETRAKTPGRGTRWRIMLEGVFDVSYYVVNVAVWLKLFEISHALTRATTKKTTRFPSCSSEFASRSFFAEKAHLYLHWLVTLSFSKRADMTTRKTASTFLPERPAVHVIHERNTI